MTQYSNAHFLSVFCTPERSEKTFPALLQTKVKKEMVSPQLKTSEGLFLPFYKTAFYPKAHTEAQCPKHT